MSSELPLVGVTTYYLEAAFGPWRRAASVVPSNYFELVAAAGGRPLLLPPLRTSPGGPGTGADDVMAALDGLILVGGGDLDPSNYDEHPHEETDGIDEARDRSERDLLDAALLRGTPVLAICRGLQILNVHLGGSLVQHLPDVVGHRGHQPAPGAIDDVDIVTVEGSRLASILGAKDTVRCSHHQAVARLGEGLTVAAYAAKPGERGERVVEALELAEAPFVVGVQWHPEESGDRRLFDALVHAARELSS